MDPSKAGHSGPTKQPKKLKSPAGVVLDRLLTGPEHTSQEMDLEACDTNARDAIHVDAQPMKSRHSENQTDGVDPVQTPGENIASCIRSLSPYSRPPGHLPVPGPMEEVREGPGPPPLDDGEHKVSIRPWHQEASSSMYYTYNSNLDNNVNIDPASVIPNCYASMFA